MSYKAVYMARKPASSVVFSKAPSRLKKYKKATLKKQVLRWTTEPKFVDIFIDSTFTNGGSLITLNNIPQTGAGTVGERDGQRVLLNKIDITIQCYRPAGQEAFTEGALERLMFLKAKKGTVSTADFSANYNGFVDEQQMTVYKDIRANGNNDLLVDISPATSRQDRTISTLRIRKTFKKGLLLEWDSSKAFIKNALYLWAWGLETSNPQVIVGVARCYFRDI